MTLRDSRFPRFRDGSERFPRFPGTVPPPPLYKGREPFRTGWGMGTVRLARRPA